MKVVVYVKHWKDIWENGIQQFQGNHPNHSIDFVDTKDAIDRDVEVLISHYGFTPEELSFFPQLKLILVPFTGVNQLPTAYLKEKGIIVCNTHAHAFDVAERGLALTLALLGRVVELDNAFRAGWKGIGDTTWTSLNGKTVGILGMGAIGMELYKLLRPFQVKLITLRRHEARLKEHGIVAEYVDSIKDVCLAADVVYNILPLTPETTGVIDGNILKDMHHKFIVNIGRGLTIDEESLYVSLRDGILRGGAFDVWYQYGTDKPSRFPFNELSNVVISPHCAGISEESGYRTMEDTLRNLENYFNDLPLNNVVRLNVGY